MIEKGRLKVGDFLKDEFGTSYFVDKIFPDNIKVWSNGRRHYISNNELNFMSYGNPIRDNRIVSNKTFAIRFKNFIENVNVNDPASEEEKEYLLNVANRLLNYQIQTAIDNEEIDYLRRVLKL